MIGQPSSRRGELWKRSKSKGFPSPHPLLRGRKTRTGFHFHTFSIAVCMLAQSMRSKAHFIGEPGGGGDERYYFTHVSGKRHTGCHCLEEQSGVASHV